MAEEEIKLMEVLFGPHEGKVLRMSAADATQAENDHWAIPIRDQPFDQNKEPTHDPLTPEERQAAEDAAAAWAAAQQPQPEPEPPPEGEARDMTPGEPGEYETRDIVGDQPPRRGPGRPRIQR